MVVEAQSMVGGRFGAADGQVDTRVLVRTDKWYVSEKAWPIWSFVTRVYAGAINRDLSLGTTNAEISTDVSNVQFGGVQLYGVLIMLCIRRALDCAASAMYSWVVEAWSMFCHAYSLWNDARLGVLMLEVLAVLLDRCGGQSGCWMHQNDTRRSECIGRRRASSRSSKGASETSGRNRDSEFECWYYEKRQ